LSSEKQYPIVQKTDGLLVPLSPQDFFSLSLFLPSGSFGNEIREARIQLPNFFEDYVSCHQIFGICKT
jgi:hypothetical protein